MATITATGSKGHHNFSLEVEERQNIIEENKSVVEFTFKISPKTKGYNWSGWANKISYTITIDGTNYTGTIGSYNGSSTVTLKNDMQDIPHNADGTKTVSFSFSVSDTSGQSYTCGNASASGTQKMITIPRASQIGVTDANIGSSTNITINKNSDSFLTSLYYKASGQNSWTQIVSKTSLQVYAWTVPTSFYSLIPNNPTISCQFYADTYSSSTATNPIGTSSIVTATFTATGNPVINSFTLQDTNSTTTALTGDSSKMIRYASNVKATVSASGQHSATISSNGIVINGTTASSGIVTFNNASTNSFKAVVKDSRQYPTEQTKTMTMVNYVPLTLNATIVRNQPTDGKVKISYSGNYFNGSFGSQNNTLTVEYRSRIKNGAWGNWTVLSPTKSGNTYSQSNYQVSGYDYTKQYNFQIRATDKIAQITTNIDVSKGEPIYWWNDEKFEITGSGKVAKGLTIGTRQKDLENFLCNSYSNKDLNNYTDPGIYYFTSGCTNAPNNYVQMMSLCSDGNNKVQLACAVAGDEIHYRRNPGGTWTSWKKLSIIVEQGTTNNGTYIKYNDGTLICWNNITVSSVSITIAHGSLYRSSAWEPFPNYPVEFVGDYALQLEGISDDNTRWWWIVKANNKGSTNVRSIVLFAAQSMTITNARLTYTAIGRWK